MGREGEGWGGRSGSNASVERKEKRVKNGDREREIKGRVRKEL